MPTNTHEDNCNNNGKKNYFEILGLYPNATQKDIEKQYKELAKKYHPDRNPSAEAAEKIKEINEAKAYLMDSKKRREHRLECLKATKFDSFVNTINKNKAAKKAEKGADYFQSLRYEKALNYYEEAITLNPIHYFYHKQLAEIYVHLENFDMAEIEITYAIVLYDYQISLGQHEVNLERAKLYAFYGAILDKNSNQEDDMFIASIFYKAYNLAPETVELSFVKKYLPDSSEEELQFFIEKNDAEKIAIEKPIFPLLSDTIRTLCISDVIAKENNNYNDAKALTVVDSGSKATTDTSSNQNSLQIPNLIHKETDKMEKKLVQRKESLTISRNVNIGLSAYFGTLALACGLGALVVPPIAASFLTIFIFEGVFGFGFTGASAIIFEKNRSNVEADLIKLKELKDLFDFLKAYTDYSEQQDRLLNELKDNPLMRSYDDLLDELKGSCKKISQKLEKFMKEISSVNFDYKNNINSKEMERSFEYLITQNMRSISLEINTTQAYIYMRKYQYCLEMLKIIPSKGKIFSELNRYLDKYLGLDDFNKGFIQNQKKYNSVGIYVLKVIELLKVNSIPNVLGLISFLNALFLIWQYLTLKNSKKYILQNFPSISYMFEEITINQNKKDLGTLGIDFSFYQNYLHDLLIIQEAFLQNKKDKRVLLQFFHLIAKAYIQSNAGCNFNSNITLSNDQMLMMRQFNLHTFDDFILQCFGIFQKKFMELIDSLPNQTSITQEEYEEIYLKRKLKRMEREEMSMPFELRIEKEMSTAFESKKIRKTEEIKEIKRKNNLKMYVFEMILEDINSKAFMLPEELQKQFEKMEPWEDRREGKANFQCLQFLTSEVVYQLYLNQFKHEQASLNIRMIVLYTKMANLNLNIWIRKYTDIVGMNDEVVLLTEMVDKNTKQAIQVFYEPQTKHWEKLFVVDSLTKEQQALINNSNQIVVCFEMLNLTFPSSLFSTELQSIHSPADKIAYILASYPAEQKLDGALLNKLGMLYEERANMDIKTSKENLNNAKMCFQKAITSEPSNMGYQCNLERICIALGDYKEAISLSNDIFEELLLNMEEGNFSTHLEKNNYIKLLEDESIWQIDKTKQQFSSIYNILSMDGNGIRGIISGTVLEAMEKELEWPIVKTLDFMVGTSTGGIIALGLSLPSEKEPSIPKYRAKDIVQIYTKNSSEIFSPQYKSIDKNGFKPRYRPDGLEKVLDQYFGDEVLGNALVKVGVTSYELVKNQPWLLNSCDHANWLMKDAARCTSAAPTYFPSKQVVIKNLFNTEKKCFVDGGVYLNNPSMQAFMEGIKQGYSPEQMNIISIGSGSYIKCLNDNEIFSKDEIITHESEIFNLASYGASEASNLVMYGLFAKHRQQGHYFRLNKNLKRDISLDSIDQKDIDELISVGKEIIEEKRDEIHHICKILSQRIS